MLLVVSGKSLSKILRPLIDSRTAEVSLIATNGQLRLAVDYEGLVLRSFSEAEVEREGSVVVAASMLRKVGREMRIEPRLSIEQTTNGLTFDWARPCCHMRRAITMNTQPRELSQSKPHDDASLVCNIAKKESQSIARAIHQSLGVCSSKSRETAIVLGIHGGRFCVQASDGSTNASIATGSHEDTRPYGLLRREANIVRQVMSSGGALIGETDCGLLIEGDGITCLLCRATEWISAPAPQARKYVEVDAQKLTKALRCLRSLGIPVAKCRVKGGAIEITTQHSRAVLACRGAIRSGFELDVCRVLKLSERARGDMSIGPHGYARTIESELA